MKDTIGRENRKLADRRCLECGKLFRPQRATAKYCSRPCAWANNGQGQQRNIASWWVDHRKGYIVGRVWINGRRVFKRLHRWIMEQHIGRELCRSEVVHHINGDVQDNRLENLCVMQYGEHSTRHNLQREHRKGYRLRLTEEQRKARSKCAKALGLAKMGRLAQGTRRRIKPNARRSLRPFLLICSRLPSKWGPGGRAAGRRTEPNARPKSRR